MMNSVAIIRFIEVNDEHWFGPDRSRNSRRGGALRSDC